jgi:hypothetical protein
MAFTASDWQHLTSQMAWVEGRMRAKRLTVDSPQFLPPIPGSQVEAFTRETGFLLPDDLIDLLTKFAGGWSFYWCLCAEAEDRWPEPAGYVSTFGGNGEVPFIGASRENTLLSLYNEFQHLLQRTMLVEPEFAHTMKVMTAVLPLYSCEGGGGDFTVMRLDTSPCEILFLDHADCYDIHSKSIIGRGLTDFLRRWANIGFPSCDHIASHVDRTSGCINSQSAEVQKWLGWLSDAPSP